MKTESCEIRIRGMICRSCTDEVSGIHEQNRDERSYEGLEYELV